MATPSRESAESTGRLITLYVGQDLGHPRRPTAGAASRDDSIGGSIHSDKGSGGAVIRTLR